jgi:hypothetical protein
MQHEVLSEAPRESHSWRDLNRVARWVYPHGVLLAILLGALAVRAYNLGAFSFWTDEFYHVVAAESLIETGTPYLPGYQGGQYTRAYPVTYLAAIGFRWFGNSEAAGRVPFLVINLAFLLVAFYVVRRWFNVHLALIVVTVLAFAPHEVRLGREVRMYGLLQLLYFSAAALVYEAMECVTVRVRRDRLGDQTQRTLPPVRHILLLSGAGVLFLLALWIQPLAANLAITIAAYCAFMTVAVGLRSGLKPLIMSKYFLALAFLVTLSVAMAIAAPGAIRELVALAKERPEWAAGESAFSFFSWFFLYYYPAFTFVYLLGAVVLVRRYGKPAAFVLCSFLPLMCAHMGFFTGKVEERYIFYILPYFFIGACFVIEGALKPILQTIAGEWKKQSRTFALLVALVSVPAASLFAHPWLRESRDMLRWGYGPNWKTVAPTLAALAGECVMMSPWPLHVVYYTGEFPDYILRKKQPEDGEGPTNRLGLRSVPVRWLYHAEEFTRVANEHDDVCVIVTDWAFNNDAYIDAGMRQAIESILVVSEHDGDQGVVIYRRAE